MPPINIRTILGELFDNELLFAMSKLHARVKHLQKSQLARLKLVLVYEILQNT